MKRWFERLFRTNRDHNNEQPLLQGRYILYIALGGLLLIIFSNFFIKDNTVENAPNIDMIEPQTKDHSTEVINNKAEDIVSDVEKKYEEHLEKMLNKIKGVSEAEVMVNLDSTNIKIFAQNNTRGLQTTEESDKNGGQRKVEDQTEEVQVVLTRQGDQEVPLLIHTKKPAVRGVFIVAKGVDHGNVQLSVIDAVSKVLDVATHKISVMPKN